MTKLLLALGMIILVGISNVILLGAMLEALVNIILELKRKCVIRTLTQLINYVIRMALLKREVGKS